MFNYFTDSVLRGPTIGCMLMCFGAALIGVIIFLRKQSLIGESLSHAAYPGVGIGVIAAGALPLAEHQDYTISLLIMIGAFISSLLGLGCIILLSEKLKIKSDSALCFVLSAFFGIGLTIASQLQFTHTALYRQIQNYLYGQAATMTDIHIGIYGFLSLLILLTIVLFYKEIQAITFDRNFSKSVGLSTQVIDTVIFILTVLAVVVGIRSVGVVLMSAMLIAPAAAARQFTNKLFLMFTLAALFGLASGYFGNYFSVELSQELSKRFPSQRLSIPTGPMIVIVATGICLLSLFFAPERGFFPRLLRVIHFRYRCMCENLLKAILRFKSKEEITFSKISQTQQASSWYLHFILWRLFKNGWITKPNSQTYKLTSDGLQWASKIVRLHKLWEIYLSNYMGIGGERVHKSAEEMEHIITPELERELLYLLKNEDHLNGSTHA